MNTTNQLLNAVNISFKFSENLLLDNLSLTLTAGEITGLMGDSGQGKTTLARILCGLTIPQKGEVLLKGAPLPPSSSFFKAVCPSVVLIGQNPALSLDPRQPIGNAIAEPMLLHKKAANVKDAAEKVLSLCKRVELEPSLLSRLPHQISGGEAQRAIIARAIGLSPSIIIADEATSLLDLVTQSQICRLFLELAHKDSLAILMISHDLPLLQALCPKIHRLNKGQLTQI